MEEWDDGPDLFWDATYAIAIALMQHYPKQNPELVGLHQLIELVIALPGFQDDPGMATERILLDIQSTWYEESVNL